MAESALNVSVAREAIAQLKTRIADPLNRLDEELVKYQQLDEQVKQKAGEVSRLDKESIALQEEVTAGKKELATLNKQISERRAVLQKLLADAK